MLEFIPLQCYECQEPIDLPVESLEDDSTTCPMCGALLELRRAEDYEPPCPAEIVIKERTPGRLRFTAPGCIGKCSEYHYLNVLFWIGVLSPFGCLIARSIFWNRLFDGSMALIFMIGFSVAITAFYQLRYMVEVNMIDDRLTVRYLYGFIKISSHWNSSTISMTDVSNVRTGRNFVAYESCLKRPKLAFPLIPILQSSTPEPARFVTHLLRRQLDSLHDPLQYHEK